MKRGATALRMRQAWMLDRPTVRVFFASAQLDLVKEELDHVFCVDLTWKMCEKTVCSM